MSQLVGDAFLKNVRVLDLSTAKGFFCGKILGDLGADVIKIEPPEGDAARHAPPFFEDLPGVERALRFLAYNTSKRGITLDITRAEGAAIFRRLAARADVIVECFTPGHLDSLGLSYIELAQHNPGLIVTSITPFGQKGPYKDFKATDLIAQAMGGLMHTTGDLAHPPARLGAEQAYQLAGAHGAIGTLTALYYRALSGEGQQVDVSLQEAVVRTLYGATSSWEFERLMVRRMGSYIRRGQISRRRTWPCKDGYVIWSFYVGGWGAREWRALVELMDKDGLAGDLKGVAWEKLQMGTLTQEQVDGWEEAVATFFLRHDKEELENEAQRRGIRLLAVRTIGELFQDPHLAERDFWQEVPLPALGSTATYPGRYFQAEPTAGVKSRPPRLGEHNAEIYGGELGLSKGDITELRVAGVI